MTIFDYLQQDHEKVERIFDELQALDTAMPNDGINQERLFNQLRSELEVHTQIEERIFYPQLQNKAETRDLISESLQEHQVVKDLLQQLVSLGKDEDDWFETLSQLRENVEHHVEEEETELFPLAKQVLTQEQIQNLTQQFTLQKKQLASSARA